MDEFQRVQFPAKIDESGIVAVGGNLSPGMLLSAYEQGVFPWYGPDEPIIWWNPGERAVILPGKLHISQSMRRFLNNTKFTVTFDQNFHSVIRSCREIARPGQKETWITDEMLEAYCELHRLGYAHSVEVWDADYSANRPAGGLYGLHLGKVFCGESMFSHVTNASKTALITLYRHLMDSGMVMIDCQVMNNHLASLGAINIPRSEYMNLLRQSLTSGLPDIRKS
ncbi:MAG: leucyl/phenylalanyl-tRNA--protein transferase [Spirochaetales bacterium]|nr:leucyl/phenylalanyl-tRNA--protein transferase [Spirochaetales bacterium]